MYQCNWYIANILLKTNGYGPLLYGVTLYTHSQSVWSHQWTSVENRKGFLFGFTGGFSFVVIAKNTWHTESFFPVSPSSHLITYKNCIFCKYLQSLQIAGLCQLFKESTSDRSGINLGNIFEGQIEQRFYSTQKLWNLKFRSIRLPFNAKKKLNGQNYMYIDIYSKIDKLIVTLVETCIQKQLQAH